MPSFRPPDYSTPALRWSCLRTDLLWIYDGPVAAESLHVAADHRFAEWVWLIRDGSVRLKMGSQTTVAHANQWLVSPHGSTLQEFSSDARILSVHFRCQWPTGENLFTENNALVLDAEKFPRLERSAHRLERLVRKHFPGVRLKLLQQTTEYPMFLKIQQRFLQWMIDYYDAMSQEGKILCRAGGGDERLWRAAECLHTVPLNSSFPAAHLQQETSLGRAQLDRLFLKEFNTTPREYWERLRQESAVRSLEATTMSIKEIGYRLGFKQPSHFTKWFSRRMGVAPQDYRVHAAESPHFKLEIRPPAFLL